MEVLEHGTKNEGLKRKQYTKSLLAEAPRNYNLFTSKLPPPRDIDLPSRG